MRSRFSRPLAFLALLEYGLLLTIFGISLYRLEGHFALPDDIGMSIFRLALVSLTVQAMMYALGLYTWRVGASVFDVLLRFFAAFILGFAAYGFIVLLVSFLGLPPIVLVKAVFASIPVMLVLRYAFMRLTDSVHTKSHVLVLGAGDKAAHLEALAQRGRETRFRIKGFIPMEDKDLAVESAKVTRMPENLGQYVVDNSVDEVVVALEERRGTLPLEKLIDARLNGAKVTEYQSFCEQAEGHIDLKALRPSWFFESAGFRSGALHQVMKRSIDIGLSLILLVFTLPLLILTAIAVKLDSPGAVFYTQERVGLGGRPFTLIKFRSMRNDAEQSNAPQWARKQDARVTRVGRVIRKTRIDEIPQIFNVLRGDMSFVGPRPERPFFVTQLAQQIPFYQERHRVRPGITGWAQLNYPYGASEEDARKKLEYDLYYIKHFSIIFDLSIALQTVRVILWADGAR
ncbi:hypothetical protein CCR80_03840 [Rhodothalassium salexigens]|uniref:TIGR03013 family XrtA/PEP-CTERM system glycosyltransferase n=1 Tax=Rhodothalassium salexigens TaxID=1086 RepID=UPI001912FBF7|nr:TIGR03013 family XrtA/PEP-CTERM system glycosyltransferase [Rhodothalassium salexigens]MBK5920170.1 hypothetical protein [Rhodothalassium salexigens]